MSLWAFCQKKPSQIQSEQISIVNHFTPNNLSEYSLEENNYHHHSQLLFTNHGVPRWLKTLSTIGRLLNQNTSILSTGMFFIASCIHSHNCTGCGSPNICLDFAALTNICHGWTNPYKIDTCEVAERRKTNSTSPGVLIQGGLID